jgi:hypothetical protein
VTGIVSEWLGGATYSSVRTYFFEKWIRIEFECTVEVTIDVKARKS